MKNYSSMRFKNLGSGINAFSLFSVHKNIHSGFRETLLIKAVKTMHLLGQNFGILKPKY